MRVLVLYIVVVALSFITHGTEANLSLSLSDYSIDGYKTFIQQLRMEVTTDTQLYGIPILKHSVSNSHRFYFIDLVNEKDEIITLAIDIVNLGVVAYRTRNKSYFFSNAPKEAFELLFPTTSQNILEFDNTFQSIEDAANTTRLNTSLGADDLESAISNLYQYQCDLVPKSFLVIIQMFIEASKFKFIEQSVINSIRDGTSFTPGLAIVSLEDNWSELSAQIQASKSIQGVFVNVIKLYNSEDKQIEVDSIYYPMVIGNIALQQYHCHVDNEALPNLIRMRGVGSDNNDARSNGISCDIKASTTRISGREGFCTDVENGYDNDGNPIILYPCGRQVNQKWRFKSDGTIRSLCKCLATNISSFGSFPVIYNCDKANQDDITWQVSSIGTILNPKSNLVLTANASKSHTYLTLEANTYAVGQAWRVGDYVNPIVISIIGLKEMCLQATNAKTNIWLENCVKNKTEQYWALYSDQTIRVNDDRGLCVTSPISATTGDALITITSCNGSPRQRWSFMSDGTILNPATSMRMDVSRSDVSRKMIILYPKNDSPNQQWLAFY